MIKVTNDTKTFFEREEGEIIIYGAGNAGFWVGWFMNKCNVDFSCYIDRNPGKRELTFNDHPIYSIDKLMEMSDIHIRLVISPCAYKEILADLLWMDHKFGVDALCLIPQYREIDTELHREVYDINHMLGYFRRKLYDKDVPTIIANTCIAGRMYDMFNMPMLSPTINTGIDYDDYIKFVMNFEHYMSKDVELLGWEKDFGNPGNDMEVRIGMVDDIKVRFAHMQDDKGIADHWNMMRKRINWDNLIFVLAAYRGTSPGLSIKHVKEFDKLKSKHLVVDMFTELNVCSNSNSIHIYDDLFSNRNAVIENEFDIIGWMNE